MRYTAIILSALMGLLIVSACGADNSSDVRKDARQSLGVQEREVPISETPPTLPTQPPSNIPPATANASGLNHYICPNNCEGSGGDAQVNCPVCGTQYVHNQAYHQQANQPATTTEIQPAATTPPVTSGPNAAGEWHYTCPNGCAGGGDSQGACASCGAALAHNQAFHN